MANIIHVLNGDCSAQLFKESGIKGDVVVFNEMLCEGSIKNEFASDGFWKERYAYFQKEFGVERIEYYDKTIKQVLNLKDLSAYNEIVLWFEFDLFCQVNLMALCTYLLKYFSKNIKYSLVCTGYVKDKERLQSLTDFSSEAFIDLYKNKLNLSKTNLLFAEECWKLYVENDIEKLQKFNFKNVKFQYFKIAMDQHLKRFSNENGLNEIQEKILEIINNNKLIENEIVKILLMWQQQETVYGFGDVQYFNYLKKLNNYFQIKEFKYYLNSKGKALITT